jgi:GAF domain-containing protein
MGDIQTWRQQLMRGLLRALVVVGGLTVVAGSYDAYLAQSMWLVTCYIAAYVLLLVIAFWRRIPYTFQVAVLMFLVYGLAVLDLMAVGRGGSGRLFLLVIPFAAGILLGGREGLLSLIVIFLTMAGVGWAYSTGLLTVREEVNSANPVGWISYTIDLLLAGTFIAVCLNYFIPRLSNAVTQSRRLARELEAERVTLEERVKERTADLQRRSIQLETAAQVAREAAAIWDVGELLEEIVHLISDRFGSYHTGIFLLDEAKEYTVLRGASSEGGRRMLARGHRLKVGEEGIVGYVVERGEPRIALDVGADAVYFDNPDLPQTRSELALPLRARGEIIGALDVQSTEPQAFNEEDVAVLQTLADQVAMAISNARLFQQAQESLDAERRAYGELTGQAWTELLRDRAQWGYSYANETIAPATGDWQPEMLQAVETGKNAQVEDAADPTLALPIKVRDQVVGALRFCKKESKQAWTPDEISLLEALVERLGLALDGARLYRDTQRSAIRERLISEITDKVRRATDMDALMQTAIREMAAVLGTPSAFVQLAIPPEPVEGEGADGQPSDLMKEPSRR